MLFKCLTVLAAHDRLQPNTEPRAASEVAGQGRSEEERRHPLKAWMW